MTQSSMTIAILLSSLDAGGAQRVALNLAEEFAARGHKVDLIVVSFKGSLADRIPAGIRIVDLGAKRARQAIGAFRNYLKTNRPAAVISIAYQANMLMLVSSIGLRPKPARIVTVHSAASRSFSGMGRFRRLAWLAATRLLYPKADAIVAVSEGAAADLVRLGLERRRVRTVHNPVLRADFKHAVTGTADHPWFRHHNVPVIITVGRLTEAKDHRFLINAFAQLLDRKEARLLVVGEGDLRADLERHIAALGLSDRVAMTGHVDNPYPLMREADVFVLSSAWEGFGNVLVEAMATGTPVVSTDCPHGPREILEDGKWGILVPPGDTEALAGAMLKVLSGGGVDASARAKDFTVEAAADKYLALLAIGEPRPAHFG